MNIEVKIACKVCGKVLDNEKDLMTHFLTEHREIGLYGTPVFVGELPIPMRKPAPLPARPKKKPKPEPEPEEDELEGYEELSLD